MRILSVGAIFLALLLLLGGGVFYAAARRSVIRDNMNMSSGSMDDMDMSGMTMATPGPGAIPITRLVAPDTNAPIKSFTLTAQTAAIDLEGGKTEQAHTFGGTVPSPELRVQQGDLVVVTLINKLPVSTSIHWHGISVPNAEDGVAGLTQDVVKPGGAYTYRFIASDVGTHWYHSHQETSIQLPPGLYGAIEIPSAAYAYEKNSVQISVKSEYRDSSLADPKLRSKLKKNLILKYLCNIDKKSGLSNAR
ncbi:MAG TPA: multicopper oxidase domain-containing protein [Aggregatilineales bacterium]|nr:multicopper oxidase domain-containing protein [Aggregatilineales bacterium]